MAEGVDLTPEQTDKLLQFQDLTGIEEIERCQQLLSTHNWDLEVAVQARFGEQEGTGNVYNPPTPPRARTPTLVTNPIDQRVYTVAGTRPHGFFGWSSFIILFPFRFVWTTVWDIFMFAYRLIRPDPRRYVTDPVGDVASFVRSFEDSYGTSHPDFYVGSYRDALNEAKQELRFLLVYLHSEQHQDTAHFCRTTLCDEDVIEYINSHTMFWACSVNKAEGYRVSQALRENTYPFLAVIVLRRNRMTMVARLEGPIGGSDLMARLTSIIEVNDTSLVAARAEREERSFNQTLREEQDVAYQESLRADQEKARKKREEEEKIKVEQEEAEQKALRELQQLQELACRKERLRDELPMEPESDNGEAVQIVLKLPNGTRLERRFLKSQSLKYLYSYVLVHEAAPDSFQIVTNFPRKVLPCEPTDDEPNPPTFGEIGLSHRELLFVHDNEA